MYKNQICLKERYRELYVVVYLERVNSKNEFRNDILEKFVICCKANK